MMYAIVRKVVTPANTSIRTVVWFSVSRNSRSNMGRNVRKAAVSYEQNRRRHRLRLQIAPGPLSFASLMKNVVYDALAEAARASEPVTLGIICGVKGSSPQKIGAKALFYEDGRIKGTLGGGCLEAEIQQRGIKALRSGEAATFDLLLDHDFGWDDGLICGGKVFGAILPNAQKVGAAFWTELAERETTLRW